MLVGQLSHLTQQVQPEQGRLHIEANDNPYEPVYRLKQGDTSVGHAINPGSLFSGQLKVALKGDDHKLVTDPYYNEPDTLTNIYGYDVDYDATVVFVHKKKSMHY